MGTLTQERFSSLHICYRLGRYDTVIWSYAPLLPQLVARAVTHDRSFMGEAKFMQGNEYGLGGAVSSGQ